MTLRDLYKKHHWQVVGPTFYQLHLLFDKHYDEQVELVDLLAERIQLLGGLSIAMAPDVAEMTRIERPPRGREVVPVQISRLLEAPRDRSSAFAHEAARRADDVGDDGTNDLLVSDVHPHQRAPGVVPGGAPRGRPTRARDLTPGPARGRRAADRLRRGAWLARHAVGLLCIGRRAA